MAKNNHRHGVNSSSITESVIIQPRQSQPNKMLVPLAMNYDWEKTDKECMFCDGSVNRSSADHSGKQLYMCSKCGSTRVPGEGWNYHGSHISESDLKTALHKLQYPSDTSISEIWGSLPMEAKGSIIETGAKNKSQADEVFKRGTYVLKVRWNDLNPLCQFVFEQGLEKLAHSRIRDYKVTENRPKNMRMGFQSGLTGKWHSWESA